MFGKRLKELRERHHYSMDKFVDLYNQRYDAKMNKSTLSRYENGLQDPIYTVVVNIADFFNVSVDYMSGKSNFPEMQDGNVIDGDVIEFDDAYIVMRSESTYNIDESELLKYYRQLNTEGREKVKEYARDLNENIRYTNLGAEAKDKIG